MPKGAVFTMKPEDEQRDQFMARHPRHMPADRRPPRAYDAFLARKVEAGRGSMRAGRGRPDAEVEAKFAARRARAVNAP